MQKYMRENSEVANKVIIRKPTESEQRRANIITSDYLISALTIHSSVLYKLGFVDKIYRSKNTNIICSNKKKVKKMFEAIEKINKKIGNLSLKTIFENGKSASAKRWITISNEEIFEGLSEYKGSDILFKDFVPIIFEYLEKIKTDAIKKHSQTVVWDMAYKHQQKVERELGENFTPKDFAINKLNDYQLQEIESEWGINLLEWEKGWNELCDYLYSPNIIKTIRNNIGVNVRARSSESIRKGTEANDKKKFKKVIENKMAILGGDFNFDVEKSKLKDAEKRVKLLENEYEESKLVVNHAAKNKKKNIMELKQACNKIRQKLSQAKKSYNELKSTFKKKKDAISVIREYEMKEKMLDEFINKTRNGEEISRMEQEDLIESLRRQKEEKQIPYYTWRFVCDKIDKTTASKIEEALEENLNKGSGVNGEDGYINVTAFPMTQSYEFFVDYPKNSNLFRAFKNKGIELSNILIDGVAKHLKTTFVSPKGEMFINSPMEKTLGGDMLEWVGL